MPGGFNTNLPYEGEIYHIQTEDKGIENPKIITCIYSKGKIIASEQINYTDISSCSDCKEKVRRLMASQHIKMMKYLIEGKYKKHEREEGEIVE
ncbi:MAG: hypothetical protein ACPL1G_06895 [Thermodesulfovibrionales bacterium]